MSQEQVFATELISLTIKQTKPNYYILEKNFILREHYRAFKHVTFPRISMVNKMHPLVTVLPQEANEFFEFNSWGYLGEVPKLPLGIFF